MDWIIDDSNHEWTDASSNPPLVSLNLYLPLVFLNLLSATRLSKKSVHVNVFFNVSGSADYFLDACTRLYRSVRRFFRCLQLKGDQVWVTAPAQLLYCPPARDWCCRVYGLVYLGITAFPRCTTVWWILIIPTISLWLAIASLGKNLNIKNLMTVRKNFSRATK